MVNIELLLIQWITYTSLQLYGFAKSLYTTNIIFHRTTFTYLIYNILPSIWKLIKNNYVLSELTQIRLYIQKNLSMVVKNVVYYFFISLILLQK